MKTQNQASAKNTNAQQANGFANKQAVANQKNIAKAVAGLGFI